jgi:hypothetical protein
VIHYKTPLVTIDFITLSEWASLRFELVCDGAGAGNYSTWDIITMLDTGQIDLNSHIRYCGTRIASLSTREFKEAVRLGDSQIYKNADKLRALTGVSMQVMLLDSLEKLRIRFVWFSIGIGLILLGFFLSGIRVYVAQ